MALGLPERTAARPARGATCDRHGCFNDRLTATAHRRSRIDRDPMTEHQSPTPTHRWPTRPSGSSPSPTAGRARLDAAGRERRSRCRLESRRGHARRSRPQAKPADARFGSASRTAAAGARRVAAGARLRRDLVGDLLARWRSRSWSAGNFVVRHGQRPDLGLPAVRLPRHRAAVRAQRPLRPREARPGPGGDRRRRCSRSTVVSVAVRDRRTGSTSAPTTSSTAASSSALVWVGGPALALRAGDRRCCWRRSAAAGARSWSARASRSRPSRTRSRRRLADAATRPSATSRSRRGPRTACATSAASTTCRGCSTSTRSTR